MSQPAARITDPHVCPIHGGGPILPPAAPTVLIGSLPAARVSDLALCPMAPDMIAMGAMNVLIQGLPAARMGDPCAHGGMVAMGCPTVLIGMAAGGGAPFKLAAETGASLVHKSSCSICSKL